MSRLRNPFDIISCDPGEKERRKRTSMKSESFRTPFHSSSSNVFEMRKATSLRTCTESYGLSTSPPSVIPNSRHARCRSLDETSDEECAKDKIKQKKKKTKKSKKEDKKEDKKVPKRRAKSVIHRPVNSATIDTLVRLRSCPPSDKAPGKDMLDELDRGMQTQPSDPSPPSPHGTDSSWRIFRRSVQVPPLDMSKMATAPSSSGSSVSARSTSPSSASSCTSPKSPSSPPLSPTSPLSPRTSKRSSMLEWVRMARRKKRTRSDTFDCNSYPPDEDIGVVRRHRSESSGSSSKEDESDWMEPSSPMSLARKEARSALGLP